MKKTSIWKLAVITGLLVHGQMMATYAENGIRLSPTTSTFRPSLGNGDGTSSPASASFRPSLGNGDGTSSPASSTYRPVLGRKQLDSKGHLAAESQVKKFHMKGVSQFGHRGFRVRR